MVHGSALGMLAAGKARLARLLHAAGAAAIPAAGTSGSVSTVKDRRYLVELLMEVERQLPVNDIVIDGVHLWPLVRLELGKKFKAVDQPGGPIPPDARAHEGGGGPSDFPATAAQRKALIRAGQKRVPKSADEARHLLEAQWARLSASAPADFLVLTKIEKYYQRIGERRYAPILDPVAEDLARYGSTRVVALEPVDFACVNEPIRLDIAPYMVATSRWRTIDDAEARRQLERVEALVRRLDPEFGFVPDAVIRRYNRLRRRAPFFRRIFETLRPRAVFLSAFTGWLPALWAARQLGIPTVDIQHAGQHSVHHAITHFSQVPRDGYALLPDYFWVWSERDRDHVSKWLPGGASRHMALVGGNRSLAKWHRERDRGELPQADRRLLAQFEGRDGIVLVTLSYAVDRLVPRSIVEAVAASPDLTWLVRLHPLHRSPEIRAEVAAELRALDSGTVHIDEPTEARLYTVLSVCCHHITPFSTSGREATVFGVPTIICHPIGGRLFAEEIERGEYVYADDARAILKRIRVDHSPEGYRISPRPPVELSDGAVDDLLARILG